MNIKTQQSLAPYNTFGMQVTAPFFSILNHISDCEILKKNTPNHLPVLVLGGGSNMLFTQNPNYWIVKNEIKGIAILREDADHVWLKVGAGEQWHEFVLWCIDKGYAGVENLSLIPGTVGAAPIQNIGAYGVEVKQLIATVHFWKISTQSYEILTNEDCQFAYRNSIFKNELKSDFIITEVVFKLNKNAQVNTTYGNIKEELLKMGIEHPNIKEVSNAVINIRSSKLPDPKVVGNAGSFFKNPEVPNAVYHQLQLDFPNIPGYKVGEKITKIPAAWLIEQCQWKGYRNGDAGVHPKQALVLVNYGNASGKEIYNLSTLIIQSVIDKFGIELEREVQVF